MPMTTAQQTDAYRFFVIAFGAAPGVTYMNQLADAYDSGMTTKAVVNAFVSKDVFKAQYPSFLTNEQFAESLVTNVVGDAATAAAKTEAQAQIVAALASGMGRGDVIFNVFNNIASKAATDATWGTLSTKLANQVAYAKYYTETLRGDSTTVATLQNVVKNVTATSDITAAGIAAVLNPPVAPVSQTFTLTTGADVRTASTFESSNVFVPGTGYVNTLNDNDVLTGTGVNPTLNVEIGASNDIDVDVQIQPTLNGIETVNVEFINSGDGENTLNLRDSEGVKTVNVNRVTDNSATASVTEMQATVTTLSLSDATRGGNITLSHQEEVLDGTAETLSFSSENVRVNALTLNEAGDAIADTGFYFETVNFTTTRGNDYDTVTIAANTREDVVLGQAANTTKQTLNFTANGTPTSGYLEINALTANGAEFINIVANARVDIAADKAANLSAGNNGITTNDLEILTISGAANVMIDGLDTQKLATKTLTVNAGDLNGDLKLGVASSSDASSSGTYVTRTDEDLRVTSGSGNDTIVTYDALAGDITTNAGNDIVRVGNATTAALSLDVEGVSRIDTGAGNDTVVARDLLVTANDKDQSNNGGYDDVHGADIDTGAGNDTVAVQQLGKASDWDNITVDDGNLNDLQFVEGSSISTGEGDDSISLRNLLEGSSVDAGAGTDSLTVTLSAVATILEGDTAANRLTLVNATNGVDNTVGVGGRTDEVNRDGTVNLLGAVIDLGDGLDSATFTEVDTGIADTNGAAPTETSFAAFTIIGTDAELRGAEVLTVRALDAVTVVTTTTTVDQDTVTAGVQSDLNANVIGTQELNLINLQQIEDTDTNDTVVAHTNGFHAVNDNNSTDASITADILRFDALLTKINLTSLERWLETGPATEVYEAGTLSTFTLQNVRNQEVNLSAFEATGVDGNLQLADDTLLTINSSTGAVTANAANADVTLNIDYAGMRGSADARTLNINSVEAFDLNLNLNGTTTDVTDTDGDGNSATGANAASTTDNDTMQVEHFTIVIADSNSHSFDMNNFGDADFTGENPAGWLSADSLSDTVTSLTINSGATAGRRIDVDAVNADTITFANTSGGQIAANVTLRVDASNAYSITTGSGNDIIDMRADDVRADDQTTAFNRSDRIAAGTGRDTLIIGGDDSLGSNGALAAGTDADQTDDDAFETMTGIERILIDTADSTSADQEIVLDEAAQLTGIDEIKIVGTAAQTLNLLVGNNFIVNTSADNSNAQTTAATSALVIDATLHTGATTLNIQNDDTDQDIDLVNMDVRVDSDGGAAVTFRNTGDTNAVVQLTVFTADEDDALTLGSGNAGNATELVDVNVTNGSIDKIVIREGENANNGTAGVAEDVLANNTVVIEADWTGTAFELDASGLADTDRDLNLDGTVTTAEAANALLTGGLTVTVEQGDTANITVRGTANNDAITTARGADVVEGNAGDDNIVGDEAVSQAEMEVINFAATYDAGDVITITHGASTMTLTLTADRTAAQIVDAIVAQDTAGLAADNDGDANITTAGFFAAAVASDGGNNVRLTGAVAGTDYVVTATNSNTNDNTAQSQSLTVGADGATVVLVWNGTTYTIGNSDNRADVGYAALITAVAAAGGTVVDNATDNDAGVHDVITITGPASGAAFALITQTDTGTLALTAGVAGTDQANPTIVTETAHLLVSGAADSLVGGAGNDTIEGMVGADTLVGGDGTDTVSYSMSLSGVSVNLATNVVSGGDAQGDVISGFENVTGSNYNDVLVGTATANELIGGRGNDSLSGGAGSDTLNAGEGADTVAGGDGIDIITLTETTSAADRVEVNATSLSNADIITGFVSGTDVYAYSGTLLNGLGTSADGIAGTDVISAATFANGLADVNSTAGVVFIATTNVANVNANTQGTAFTALLSATASNLSTLWTALETQLLATDGALTGAIANLDGVLTTADSVLLVLDNGVGSVVLRVTNSSTTVANTLTAAEIDLVGVLTNTSSTVAADFIFGGG